MSKISVPEYAPGCFGSALTFEKTDMICKACPFSDRCEPASAESKSLLRSRFGIVFKSKTIRPVPQEVGNIATVECEKTRKLIERIDRADLNIVGKLLAGANPFDQQMKFMAIACHIFLRRETVTQNMITVGCVHTLKIQHGAADCYARIALKALVHIGAITNNDGRYSLKRG